MLDIAKTFISVNDRRKEYFLKLLSLIICAFLLTVTVIIFNIDVLCPSYLIVFLFIIVTAFLSCNFLYATSEAG